MPDSYVVERSATIAAPPADVFEHIVDLHKWEAWSPWASIDPSMTTTYTGEAGAVGSTYHWSGNRKVGEGKMTVTEVDSPSRVAIDLQFIKPFKSQSVTEMRVDGEADGSTVTWTMTGAHTRISKIMGIFRSMDKMVGPDFEKGLASLKQVVEVQGPSS